MKNILITGASSGIGAALAKAYAEPGTQLFLTGRNEERLIKISTECEKLGAAVYKKVIDVTDYNKLKEWVKTIDETNPITIVIANAGTYTHTNLGNLEAYSTSLEIINTNVLGVIATVEPLLHSMKLRNKGHVVFLSSQFSFFSLPNSPTYSASKAAINVYADGIGMSLANTNVKITTVYPGLVTSRITDQINNKKPFIVSAEKAACIIKSGIRKNKKRIIFPMKLFFLIKFSGLLPRNIFYQIFKWISAA